MIFIKILFFLFPIFSQPTIDWFVEYNGSGEESHGHFILKCDDGGFIQVGETDFLPNSKLYVVKTDASGQFLWEREINIGNHNLGNSVIELDDGYLICGGLNRNSALIKLDKQTGATIFSQTFNNGGTDAFGFSNAIGVAVSLIENSYVDEIKKKIENRG